jgi:hypothetical protein
MRPLLDACGSWWTQGVSAELQPRLARVIGCVGARCKTRAHSGV